MKYRLSEEEKRIAESEFASEERESNITGEDYEEVLPAYYTNEEMASMLRGLPGGYHRCSSEDGFSFLYISDRFLDILGWTREEILDKFDNKFENMVHPDDRKEMRTYVDAIVSPVQKENYIDKLYRMQGKDVDCF